MSLKKNNLLFFLTIIALFFVFKIGNKKTALPYDVVSESLIVGRLLESERTGIFTHGGLTGFIAENEDDYYKNALLQFELLDKKKLERDVFSFFTYNSQPGFQGIIYALLNKVSPFNLKTTIAILQNITILLNSLILSLFLMWSYRNFGKTPYLITFILLASSSWLWQFSDSLWWCLWAFYLPFLTSLLFFETHKDPTFKFYTFLFLSLLIKCLINGFEYITTTVLAGFVPLIYYAIQYKKNLRQTSILLFKSGLSMFFSITTAAGVLIIQISSLKGSLKDGIDHIILSYNTRTSDAVPPEIIFNITENKYFNILLKYMGNDVFSWLPIKVPFGIMIAIIFLVGLFNYKKQKTLVITTFISIIAAISWHLVFIQHSVIHDHLNFITWYIPFLLFGFLCMGVAFNCFIQKIVFFKKDH